MECTVKERLIIFIDSKNISVREFERLCNLSNGYVKGIKHTILPAKMKGITLQYPELNPVWLLMGDGEMLLNSKKEEGVLQNPNQENSEKPISQSSVVKGDNAQVKQVTVNKGSECEYKERQEFIGLLKEKDNQINELIAVIKKLTNI